MRLFDAAVCFLLKVMLITECFRSHAGGNHKRKGGCAPPFPLRSPPTPPFLIPFPPDGCFAAGGGQAVEMKRAMLTHRLFQ